MYPSPLKLFSCLVACGSLVGCNGGDVNNPKMPDIPPAKIQVDSSVPKGRGDGGQPYGANKKYQDMMNH